MCLHGGSINRLPSSLIASKGVIKKRPERFFPSSSSSAYYYLLLLFCVPALSYAYIHPSVSSRRRLFELLSLESRYRISVCIVVIYIYKKRGVGCSIFNGFLPHPPITFPSTTFDAFSGVVFFVFFYQITRRYGCSSSGAASSAPAALCVHVNVN